MDLDSSMTGDINEKLVIPLTRKIQCSYYDFVKAKYYGTEKDFRFNNRHSGKATVFVSHAWKYKFVDLIAALEGWLKDKPAEEIDSTYFWIDLFMNNQHGASTRPFEWWETTFRESIEAIGLTLIVFSPWQCPLYVERAWCLFEFYTTVSAGVRHEIILPPTQKAELINYLKYDYDLSKGLFGEISQINIENASAFLKSDLERILTIVKQSVGFAKLNTLIFNELRRWVVKVGEETLAGMTEEELYRSSLQINLAGVLSDIGRQVSSNCLSFRLFLMMMLICTLYSDVICCMDGSLHSSQQLNEGRYGESERHLRSSLQRHLSSSSSSFRSRAASCASEGSSCDDDHAIASASGSAATRDGGCMQSSSSSEEEVTKKYDEGTFKHLNKLSKLLIWLGKNREAEAVLKECNSKMEVRL
jgi:hypothetical protein